METTIQISTIQPVFQKIHEIRGQKVMLDFDLAELYGTETKYLKRAVNRNFERFPVDFMFQLTKEEHDSILRCQIGTSKYHVFESEENRGGNRYLPYAFTEQGVAMLSSVLNSDQAVQVNIAIFRAFIWLRKALPAHQELASKVAELEEVVGQHDAAIGGIIETLNEMMLPPNKDKRRIGF